MITVMTVVEMIWEVGIANDTIVTMMIVEDDIRELIGIDAKVITVEVTVLVDETMTMTIDHEERTETMLRDATRIAPIEDANEAGAAAGTAVTDTEDVEKVVHRHRRRAKVLNIC